MLDVADRGFIQFRPAGAQNMGEMYAPARDLVWNFLPTTIGVIESLKDTAKWPAWMTEYATANNVTIGDIAVAGTRFAKAAEQFANPDLPDIMTVMQTSEYLSSPEPARILFQMQLGKHVTGMYFTAVRDFAVGEKSPTMAAQIAAMEKKSRELTLWLDKTSPLETNFVHGYRTITRGLGICLRSVWCSISKLWASPTPTLSGKSDTSSSVTEK